jgi:hypothetical protein
MFLPLHTKACFSSHTPRRVTDDYGLQVTPDLQVLNKDLASYHLSGTKNFMVVSIFLENLCNSANSILYLH